MITKFKIFEAIATDTYSGPEVVTKTLAAGASDGRIGSGYEQGCIGGEFDKPLNLPAPKDDKYIQNIKKVRSKETKKRKNAISKIQKLNKLLNFNEFNK